MRAALAVAGLVVLVLPAAALASKSPVPVNPDGPTELVFDPLEAAPGDTVRVRTEEPLAGAIRIQLARTMAELGFSDPALIPIGRIDVDQRQVSFRVPELPAGDYDALVSVGPGEPATAGIFRVTSSEGGGAPWAFFFAGMGVLALATLFARRRVMTAFRAARVR